MLDKILLECLLEIKLYAEKRAVALFIYRWAGALSVGRDSKRAGALYTHISKQKKNKHCQNTLSHCQKSFIKILKCFMLQCFIYM